MRHSASCHRQDSPLRGGGDTTPYRQLRCSVQVGDEKENIVVPLPDSCMKLELSRCSSRRLPAGDIVEVRGDLRSPDLDAITTIEPAKGTSARGHDHRNLWVREEPLRLRSVDLVPAVDPLRAGAVPKTGSPAARPHEPTV